MFNSTHTFVGLAIAQAAPKDWLRLAPLTAVIASNLPDIDILTNLSGMPTYIEYHRGITHTLLGVPILALGVALAMYAFSGNFWKTYLVALIAMATHPALDYTNTYGLRPFLPFDGSWYYGDLLFVFDPYIDSILLAGILAGQPFKRGRRVIAWISILLAFGYIGFRIHLRSEAGTQLDAFASKVAEFERSALLPEALDPALWDGIVETKDQIIKVRVNALAGVTEEIGRAKKGPWSAIVARAAAAPAASSFLGFARFPIARVDGADRGYRVTFTDFRFYNEVESTAFAAEVMLDRSLHVVKDSLSFNKPVDLD